MKIQEIEATGLYWVSKTPGDRAELVRVFLGRDHNGLERFKINQLESGIIYLTPEWDEAFPKSVCDGPVEPPRLI